MVTKVLGAVNYLIQKGPRAKAQVVHVDKLKRCEGTTPKSWLTDPVDQVVADDQPEPAPAEATPTAPPEVGGGQLGPAGSDPGPESGSGVTTKVNNPNSSPPLGVDSVRFPKKEGRPTRVQPKRNAPRPRRFLMTVRNSGVNGSDEGRLQ